MLELLDTLKERNSHKGNGHFRIWGTLTIGHALHPGVQRVQSWPFKDMHYHGSNRQDFVFIRPPGIEEGGFMLRPDNAWYCKVLLLFSIQAQTDQNGSTEEFQCAFVSVLKPLAERSPDRFKELRKRGSLVLLTGSEGSPCLCCSHTIHTGNLWQTSLGSCGRHWDHSFRAFCTHTG